jgi:alpha-D-xyloside xylohydrolase
MGEFMDPIIKIDNLRYRLMPYIYSLSWMVTNKDYTIMRGLPMDFVSDKNTYSINDQFMFGPSIMVCPVTEYMYHTPPQASIMIEPEYFKTVEGEQGLSAKYYKDPGRKILSREAVDPNIDIFWYTGRPDYATDSMYAITWEGKIVPKENGLHQFHLVSYDPKRIILNGDTLRMVYTSTEQYTEKVNLEAGKEYSFKLETENRSTGAAKCRLYWKTPSIFAKEEEKAIKEKSDRKLKQMHLSKKYLYSLKPDQSFQWDHSFNTQQKNLQTLLN